MPLSRQDRTSNKRTGPRSTSKTYLQVQKQYAIHFIVTGGANEVLLCDTVANASGGAAVSIAGMTQMVDLMRLLDNACLVVGNDSGAGHLSGALGVPTIVINSFPRSCTQEHPYSPQRFRPMGPRVLCCNRIVHYPHAQGPANSQRRIVLSRYLSRLL